MAIQYDADALKAIGMQCKNKLPPASTVQAMFLYELQRQTEAEALFEGQMFALARAEDESTALRSKVESLEGEIKELKKQAVRKEIDERIAFSKVRTDALGLKLDEQVMRINKHDIRLTHLESNAAATAQSVELERAAIDIIGLKADLTDQDKDVSTLFDERDALVALLNTANTRIDKLEDLVRALTLQKSTPSTLTPQGSNMSSPKQVHFLPVQTKNNENVELAVTKGDSFAPHTRKGKGAERYVAGKQ